MSEENVKRFDSIVIGGGAAGLMCAIEAGKRSRSVLLLERAEKVGKKILISGGGRCNFTNIHAGPHAYISENEHFFKSALSRYLPQNFISMVEQHKIEYYEKTLGQLFCRTSAREITKMLTGECAKAAVEIRCGCDINSVQKDKLFQVKTSLGDFHAESLVVATGGISIPKMGATGFGYEIAQQFDLSVTDRRPGLVPFVFDKQYLAQFEGLSGISMEVEVSCRGKSFREMLLITHRGISGPAVLQISSYWLPGDVVTVNLIPDADVRSLLTQRKIDSPETELKSVLSEFLPKRFVQRVFELWLPNKPLKQLMASDIDETATFFNSWELRPSSTEGFRTAEVTVGGVNVNELSSKTFEAKKVPRLYFIGEVVDVTGWLGGYNFQWAWASGFCAGQFA